MSVRLLCAALLLGAALPVRAADVKPLRPPSVPLVAHDPYFCIWSPADRLTDKETVHWTGKPHPLHSLVRIDDKAFRLMGAEPVDVEAFPQVSVTVLPTRTVYAFQNEQVHLALTFLTPALPDDLDLLARPVTHVIWEAKSADGKTHDVAVYFDAGAALAVNVADQAVVWNRVKIDGLVALRCGSKDQPVLAKRGDDLRIDWGYLYVAVPEEAKPKAAAAAGAAARKAFVTDGGLPADDDRMPRAAKDEAPALAVVLPLGTVGAQPVARHALIAYDDLLSIVYFKKRLKPYWRRNGAEAADILKAAAKDHAAIAKRCAAFDDELMADLAKAGGEAYARICALAYRQCLAGNKVAADAAGMPLVFPKENFSNGCIATVDVIYPMAPQFLLLCPALAKGMLVNVLDYAASPRWKFPFAPHDLGTYPMANGQVYGGGENGEENQMPVEESGNMLALVAAVAVMDGNADFAATYWPQLTAWAEYLKGKGFDPENQLCTDDFAGHLAHNVNLSAKAIVGLASYALLCSMRGKADEAAAYRRTAEAFAAKWAEMAGDGDHFRLAFDKPGTWSQKYNLVWDRVLGLRLFPPAVAAKELAYYRTVQKKYGLPLDNRKGYTKLDWILWTATITGAREDFDALVAPVYDFLCESPSRVPMTDWYETGNGRQVGFQARPVVGGVFVKMLDDAATWKTWASRGAKAAGAWAPWPAPPATRPLAPAAQAVPVAWRYTLEKPADDWAKPGFDASAWKEGPAGFGTRGTPGSVVRTEWKTAEIWIRREFDLAAAPAQAALVMHHDEDAEVYINGTLAARTSGYTTQYEDVEMSPEGRAALKPGGNVIAVHCRQTVGGQYIDAGIVEVVPAK